MFICLIKSTNKTYVINYIIYKSCAGPSLLQLAARGLPPALQRHDPLLFTTYYYQQHYHYYYHHHYHYDYY